MCNKNATLICLFNTYLMQFYYFHLVWCWMAWKWTSLFETCYFFNMDN